MANATHLCQIKKQFIKFLPYTQHAFSCYGQGAVGGGQKSVKPDFLAPGTDFVEDNFSMDEGGGGVMASG